MLHSSRTIKMIRTSISIGVVLFLYVSTSLADTLTVQPSQLAISAKQPTGTVKLTNSGAENRIIRFQVMIVTQVNGQEPRIPSRKLILYPEQVTVKPGTSQNVRVGLRLSGPLWEQENYQLLVTEVPRPPDVGSAASTAPSTNSQQLAVLPIAVLPPGQSSPRVVSDLRPN